MSVMSILGLGIEYAYMRGGMGHAHIVMRASDVHIRVRDRVPGKFALLHLILRIRSEINTRPLSACQ